MKKVLFAVLIVFVATTVYAGSEIDPSKMSRAARERTYEVLGTPEVTFDLNGEFSAAGFYWDNYALYSDDTVTHSYYKGYLSLYPKLTVGDTSVIMKIDMRDQVWGTQMADATGADKDNPDQIYNRLNTQDANDNISVERAYLSQKFGENTVLDVGLMSGQWWATKFGDYTQPRYRVKVTQKTPVGVIGALVEKDAEYGTATTEDTEKDDYDSYALFGATKLGPLNVKPLFFYVDRSSTVPTASSDGLKRLYISVGIDGNLGPIEIESEWTYQDTSYEDLAALAAANPLYTFAEDSTVYGAYVNLFKTMDFGKAGLVLVYLGYDEEGGPLGSGHGLDSRQDFKANLIIGDEIGFGSIAGQSAEDLLGMTMVKPYVQGVKMNEWLTCDASFAYIMSNQDDYSATVAGAVGANPWVDAAAWEIDLGLNCKISPNTYYLVDAGYADIDFDEGDDPDSVMVLKHEILFTF